MANISTSNRNAIYKYTGTIKTAFKNDKQPLTIDNMRIKSIVIDHNYNTHNFPLIYLTISLTMEMVKKLKDNQTSGTVIFALQKYIENSDMPGLTVDVINKECVYFMSNDNAKDKEQAINPDRTDDYGYIITIGLIALDHINKNKSSVNGVIKAGTMSASIYYVLKNHNLLLEPLTYNKQMGSAFIPPLNSTSRIIKYLNNLSVFYNTPYRFYMDFDTTYLVSSSGKGTPKKGDLINTIKLNIRGKYDESNMEGMKEDKENKMYILDISGTYANIAKTLVTEKTFNKIEGVTVSGQASKADIVSLDKSNPIKASSNSIRLPNNNTGLLDNMKASTINSGVVLTINKNKIDSSIFTINKVFTIDATEVYGDQYNGHYLLTSKRELYAQEGKGLAVSVLLTFNKLNNQLGE